ncbi:hypothetical protein SAMN06298216_3163 [Spirosomataceae bacterium TFI 002]|nr:hypothetical protein SAMN06298216_3163 [Spirosomataceae bacterium TFI 002]
MAQDLKDVIFKTKISKLLFYLAVILIFIKIWSIKKENKKEFEVLKSDFTITNGVITRIVTKSGNPGSFFVYFSFTVEKVKFEGYSGYAFKFRAGSDKLIGRTFPVAFQQNNIENCEILLSKELFNDFFLTYPDSLNYVDKMIK